MKENGWKWNEHRWNWKKMANYKMDTIETEGFIVKEDM